MSNVAANDAAKLRAMIAGYMVSQVTSVAAVLGLADLLAAGPMSGKALAEATGTHGRSLLRLLRALSTCGLVEEIEPEHFELTVLGALLRTDVPGSLRDLARFQGAEPSWRAWGNLLHAVRTGETGFEHVFGMGAFRYSALDPERAARFDTYMGGETQRSVEAILQVHDFTRYRRMVDVGGGNGVLLGVILAAVPHAEGTVFDTAAGAAGAMRRLEQMGVADRCRIVAGDFFVTVPDAADAYLLKSVLHDWDDDRAVAILKNCRRAMRADSRLLIVERLLPERIACSDAHREIVMMDMHMLVVPGGRERTFSEYAEVLSAAGLKPIATQPTKSPFALIEAARTDAAAG